MKKLNQKEVIYGFCVWLTFQEKVVKMGSSENCGVVPDLIEEFSKVNNFEDVTDDWPNNLIHPSGECSHINNT